MQLDKHQKTEPFKNCVLCAESQRLCVLSEACSKGLFGEGCEQSCDCVHSTSCHHVMGRCECEPGWRGARCDKRECVCVGRRKLQQNETGNREALNTRLK